MAVYRSDTIEYPLINLLGLTVIVFTDLSHESR